MIGAHSIVSRVKLFGQPLPVGGMFVLLTVMYLVCLLRPVRRNFVRVMRTDFVDVLLFRVRDGDLRKETPPILPWLCALRIISTRTQSDSAAGNDRRVGRYFMTYLLS